VLSQIIRQSVLGVDVFYGLFGDVTVKCGQVIGHVMNRIQNTLPQINITSRKVWSMFIVLRITPGVNQDSASLAKIVSVLLQTLEPRIVLYQDVSMRFS